MSNFAREMRQALLGLAGAITAAADQADSMTDKELGERLTTGRWTTIEVHEAGRRLLARPRPSGDGNTDDPPGSSPKEGG